MRREIVLALSGAILGIVSAAAPAQAASPQAGKPEKMNGSYSVLIGNKETLYGAKYVVVKSLDIVADAANGALRSKLLTRDEMKHEMETILHTFAIPTNYDRATPAQRRQSILLSVRLTLLTPVNAAGVPLSYDGEIYALQPVRLARPTEQWALASTYSIPLIGHADTAEELKANILRDLRVATTQFATTYRAVNREHAQ